MNVSDYDGRCPLHLAAAEGHLECVRFLVDTCKVNPNPEDRWKRTPLTEAVHFERANVAAYLKEYMETHPEWREEEEEDDEDDGDEEYDDDEVYDDAIEEEGEKEEEDDENGDEGATVVLYNIFLV